MDQTGRLLFVDDEASMCQVIKIALEKDGHAVDTATTGPGALELFRAHDYDMVIHDLKMPDMDGLELLRQLRSARSDLPVVILTAHGTWDSAVEAMRLGAYDYLNKPFDNDELRALVHRTLNLKELRDNPADTAQMRLVETLQIIGSTPVMQEILALVRRVAATDSTVIIQGESGTGKEMIARLLHLQSLRRNRPFIAVNCGAFSETLLESEIFGHLKGSFTGAVADKKGMLEIAEGGAFFLDEVAEMTPPVQVRLLRALETREYVPVGGTQSRRADVRFLAATNQDLGALVEKGAFREDLFYRLNVIPIFLPPLRERREDIPLLAGHFLALYNRSFGLEIEGFSDEAMQRLMAYDWPGNVRELQNTVQRAMTLVQDTEITKKEISLGHGRASVRKTGVSLPPLPEEGFDLDARLEAIEADYIRQALEKTGGNLTQAAERLGITFRSIRYKVKKLGLNQA